MRPSLRTVANRITIGKDEKSMGLEVLMATIMMSSAKIILKVKKISSIKAGSGSTSNEITMSTAAGIARDVANVSAEPLLRKCRKFVKILSAKSTLMPYHQKNPSIAS